MLSFIQTEFAGLRSRWLRVLALLTCLVMALVIAEQQRAIEAQGTLIASLSSDSNQAKLKVEKAPRISVYITDSRIIEPASKTPGKPAVPGDEKPVPNTARIQKLL